jgi:hypothetical protein
VVNWSIPPDRGGQDTAARSQPVLAAPGVTGSMSRAANGLDNARAESCCAPLKDELIDRQVGPTRRAARQAIVAWLEVFSTRQRRHSALGSLSPAAVEARLARGLTAEQPGVHETGATSPAQSVRRLATQEIDCGRRSKGSVFGAFQPAAGHAFTTCCSGRTTANWVDFLEALDWSRGGFSAKVQVRAEGQGKPLVFVVSGGERHESRYVPVLMEQGAVKRPGRGRPRLRQRGLARSFPRAPTSLTNDALTGPHIAPAIGPNASAVGSSSSAGWRRGT